MNLTLIRSSDDTARVRTLKLVRLRVGVFADGTAVSERQPPRRVVHVVDISADLDMPDGVTAYCGAHFAPGTLVEVPWMTIEPHQMCRRQSPFPADLDQPGRGNGAQTDFVEDDPHNDKTMLGEFSASIRVVAQWSVRDPVIYVNYAAESECVDLAIGGDRSDDVIAHFQLKSPLDVLAAGHDLVSAGLHLADALGMDIDQLKAATPSTRWGRGQTRPDTTVADEELPDL